MKTAFFYLHLFGFLTAGIILTAGEAISQEQFEMKTADTTYTMKKYYLCLLNRGPKQDIDSVTLSKIQKGHLEHITQLAKDGKICIAGPCDDDADLRGIMVFTVSGQLEAEQLAAEDPAVKAGRLSVEIHPWWAAKGSVLK